MKRFLASLVCCVIMVFITTFAYAQCSATAPVLQGNTGELEGLTGTIGTDFQHFFWWVGNGAANNSGTYPQNLIAANLSGSTYYMNANWNKSAPGPIGCPGNTDALKLGTRTAWVTSHRGASGGDYILASQLYISGSNYLFDHATLGVNNGNGIAGVTTMTPVAIPAFTSCNLAASGLHYNVTMAWPAISNLKGFYNTGNVPANNLITGIRIRWAGGASAPAQDIANWPNTLTTVSTSGAGTDPGSITSVALPDGPLPSGGIWFRMFLVFDGGAYETPFGGPAIAGGTPTATGLFVQDSVSASHGQVTVNWRTNVESGVAGFDVVYSRTKAGTFTLVAGTATAPKGNNSAYSVTFPKPVRAEKLFFKVQAHMMDGSSQFSDLMKLGDDNSGTGIGKVLPD